MNLFQANQKGELNGYVKIDLGRWPNLVKFRHRMETRPAVQRVLEKEAPVKA